MSDTEEVVLTRNTSRIAAEPIKRNTKPEIAREKLKAKRERLKKEKEDLLIEEAKKRLVEDNKKAEQEALMIKKQEEEQKLKDPSYMMLKRMEEMMAMFQSKVEAKPEPQPEPLREAEKKKRAPRKKVEIPEPEPEPEPEEKPKRKPRQPKQVVDKPNKAPGLPKPRKKVVYLQQDPVPEESTQFVGYDVAPPAEPIQYQPSNGLLSALMGRRNMNTAF
jgi:hypothetical protein